MATIELDEDLAYSFIGALLNVARLDGAISLKESEALRTIAGEITTAGDFDFEFALTQSLSVADFAAKLRESADGPFRGAGSSVNPKTVAEAFVDAARRVAEADDGPQAGEERLIRDFKSRFGLT